MDELFRQIALLFPEFERYFSAGFIIFARLLGFIRFAPVLNRKEINTTVKISLAFMLTIIITPLVHPGTPQEFHRFINDIELCSGCGYRIYCTTLNYGN